MTSITQYVMRGTSFAFSDPTASVARDSVPGHSYEPLVGALLENALKEPNAVFADVGALYGFFSCWAATHAPAARVVAFEPEPTYVAEIERNRALNGVEFEIASVALSDANATLQFHGRTVEPDAGFKPWRRNYVRAALRSARRALKRETASDAISLRSSGDSPVFTAWDVFHETLVDNKRPASVADETHSVSGVTLDSWAQDNDFWPTVIKMDVHGGEGPALRGMTEALSRAQHLLLELHTPDYLVDSSLSEIVDILVGSGMELYELRGFRRSRGTLVPLTAQRRRDLVNTDTWSPEDLYFMKFLYATRRPLA